MDGKYKELHRLLLWRQLGGGWEPRCNDGPHFLEIGFGNGEYLLRQALQRPQHNFIGVEIHWGSVRRCLRRLAQAGVDNVRLLKGDAQMLLQYLFPDQCMESFVALFPCPWPKRDHLRYRLFSTEFMAHLNRVCRQGGLVVTDHLGLMEFAREQASGSGLEVEVVEVEARYDTKYERRWSGQGQQWFYELHYRRAAASPLHKIKEVGLETLTRADFDPEKVELVGISAGLVVHFRQQLYDPKRQVWMVLATVVEDHLNQTFWIEATRKEDGLWYIQPAAGGGFLPTVGVQKALTLVQQSGQQVQTG